MAWDWEHTAATPPREERIVRFYRGGWTYEQDAARLAAAGWRVVRAVPPPRWGWRRLLEFGLLDALGHAEPELLVTYARARAAGRAAARGGGTGDASDVGCAAASTYLRRLPSRR